MNPLTKLQREEIIGMLQIRRDSITTDESNADAFEAIPGALDTLEKKLNEGQSDFTALEKVWMIEEFEKLIDMANGNKKSQIAEESFIRSMNNAIEKLKYD